MSENKNIPIGAEVIKFVGIAPYNFVPDGQSKAISGVNMFYLRRRDGAYGYVPDKVKISVEDFEKSCTSLGIINPEAELVGIDLVCCFNRFGKCNAFYFA